MSITEDESDNDLPLCQHCNGSGEGMYDGSRCISCGGCGVERYFRTDISEANLPDDDYIGDYEWQDAQDDWERNR